MVIAGHGDGEVAGTTGSKGIAGKLVKVRASDGVKEWAKSYTAGGTVELIYNECWGVVALSDGYALSCGAGIEGCELHASGSAMHTDCVAGRGDTRAGAKLLGPGLWNSLAIRTDLDGTLIWQRADQYREAGDPGIDDSTWEATTSASEWVVVLADGALGFINDEANGVGLLRLTEHGCVGAPAAAAAGCSSSSSSSVQARTHPKEEGDRDRDREVAKTQRHKQDESEDEEGEEGEEEDAGGNGWWRSFAGACLALGLSAGGCLVCSLACFREGSSDVTVPIVKATAGEQHGEQV